MSQDYTYIWFHVTSQSEWEQVYPLMERIRHRYGYKRILVTFSSPEACERHKTDSLIDEAQVLPKANRKNVKQWLENTKIEMAFFVSYAHVEAYIRALRKAEQQVYLLNALIGERHSSMRWSRWSERKTLKCFNIIFVQDEASRDRLENQKITNTIVAGNTLVDRAYDLSTQRREVIQLERFVEPRVTPDSIILPVSSQLIVAADTWPSDERLLAEYMHEHPELKLVLAPHDISDEHIHFIFNLFQGRFVRLSQATMQNLTACQTLLIDKPVNLALCYRYGHVAYIGGGFDKGVHNVVEPAAQSLPVIFGTHYRHSREAVHLLEQGGAICVKDSRSLENALSHALAEHETIGANAKRYILEDIGTSDTILDATLR